MNGLLEAVFLTAAVALPMMAFAHVARDPDWTVARMIAEPAIAGLLAGAAIGLLGALARLIGRIWSDRI